MRTLLQLRNAVFAALGFLPSLTMVQTRTLAQLRTDLMAALGYAAQSSTPPTGMNVLLDVLINNAQNTLWRRVELGKDSIATPPTPMVLTTDVTTLDYVPVLMLATAMGKAHYAKPDAKLYFDQVERWVVDYQKRRPANATVVVNQMLLSAQNDLYRRYPMLETERFYTWNTVSGQNCYDFANNLEQTVAPISTTVLDPRKITWAGIERDGIWMPLICGIPPECYSHNDWSGWPSRYEIRQCIELWPVPGTEVQKLRMKGHFGLLSFIADSDPATVDDEAVYLLAVANAKAYYQQSDAGNYVGMLETYIRNLVAGLHQTRRYIPSERRGEVYVSPKPTGPFPP